MSLMDPKFAALAFAAIVLLPTLRGTLRQLAFLLVNCAFVGFLFLGMGGAPLKVRAVGFGATLGFCLLGYALTLLIRRRRDLFWPSLVAYVVVFVYMSNYQFLHWVLPERLLFRVLAMVGLSFLFFKVVHVMVEAHGETLGRLEPLTYLNFCLNFTTFMMGPLQRYQDYAEQWHGVREAIPLTFEAHLDAVLRILVGLVKAYVLAAFLRPYTLGPDTDVAAATPLQLLLAIYAFYLYLYLNFGGYCDVVIGLGSLIGVRPPENFDKPFLARNVSEFWQRQHRSLTLWLTDYVFSPLYKWSLHTRWLSSRPLLAANVAVFVTLLVSGLWHGTTTAFLIFGIVHGLYQVVYRTWDGLMSGKLGRQRLKQLRQNWAVQGAGMVITFHAVALAFVFFQLDAVRAWTVFGRLVGIDGGVTANLSAAVLGIL
jgi:D-alanyl-lipoteichoic acid acyltransferase DltB (MBOAT superfamily)